MEFKHMPINGANYTDADIKRLCETQDRPLPDTLEKCKKLYAERHGIYQSTADVIVPDMMTPEAEAEFVMKKRLELMK